MKKIIYSLIIVLGISTFIASCNKQESLTEPNNVKAKTANQPIESAILETEKELNVTLYKRDVKLTDKSGENSVTIRFASRDESSMEDYFTRYEYSITPIYSKNEIPSQPASIVQNKLVDNGNHNFSVITEEVSRNLRPNTIGYAMNVKQKTVNGKNARPNYTDYSEHTGPTWCEQLHTTCTSGSIIIQIEEKDNWYSSWDGFYTNTQLDYNGEWYFDIDPFYRARLMVQHNGGNYTYWFYCD